MNQVETANQKQEELKHIQGELLNMLKDFDYACRKNGIKYSMHGGTLLGAVRHHGFIPWDDDVDITMTYDELERFKRVMVQDLPDYWLTDEITTGPKLMRKHYNNRPIVYLDILEYDFITENKLLQKAKIALLTLMAGMCRTKDTIKNATVKKHGIVKIVLLRFVYGLGLLFPLRVKLKWHHALMRKAFTGKKEFIHRANDQVSALSIIYPKKYMESFVNLPFENTMLMASRYYKEILISCYGVDYLKLPPPEDRVSHEKIVRQVVEKMQREYEQTHSLKYAENMKKEVAIFYNGGGDN